VSGSQQGVSVVFLHTTLETGDHYYQILAWTLKPRWAQQKELLAEVTRSFHRGK
jgi:hypothetical protein